MRKPDVLQRGGRGRRLGIRDGNRDTKGRVELTSRSRRYDWDAETWSWRRTFLVASIKGAFSAASRAVEVTIFWMTLTPWISWEEKSERTVRVVV